MPSTAQERVEVTDFNLAGPYAVAAPFAVDTVAVKGKRFEDAALLGVVRPDANATTTFHAPAPLPSLKEQKSVGVLSFYVNNADYVKLVSAFKELAKAYEPVVIENVEGEDKVEMLNGQAVTTQGSYTVITVSDEQMTQIVKAVETLRKKITEAL